MLNLDLQDVLAVPGVEAEAAARIHRALTEPLANNLEKSLIQKQSQLVAAMDSTLASIRARLGRELYGAEETPISPAAMFFFKKMKRAFVEAEEGYSQGHTEQLHHQIDTSISGEGLSNDQLRTMKLSQHAVCEPPVVLKETSTGAEMVLQPLVRDLEIQCQEDQLCEEEYELRDTPAHPPLLNSDGQIGLTPWIKSYRGEYNFS